MDTREAVDLLNVMRFMPGTRLQFWAGAREGEVRMSMAWDSYESTPTATGRHEQISLTTPPISFNVRDMDAEHVLAAGLKAGLEVYCHEAREFWRAGTGDAPFHPHNTEGEAAWQRCKDVEVNVQYPRASNPKPTRIPGTAPRRDYGRQLSYSYR